MRPARSSAARWKASREFHVDVALVGREAEILACLNEMDVMPGEHIQIVNAPDVISMEDDPSTATRKKPESSMSVALQMLHRGEGDAVISAGSTGALLSGATLTVRRIRGIRRACFGPVIPNGGKGTLLIDCGANVECTAGICCSLPIWASSTRTIFSGAKIPASVF